MAVDTDFTSLLNNLKVEDPWLPPRPWESIPTESGLSVTSTSSSSSTRFYDTSSVSEASLVRLAMNALQGLETSLISIEKLCAIFQSDPTDRTFHRIPSLWTKSAFAVAVNDVLEGYVAALDTLYSSVRLRRSSNVDSVSSGCLSCVGHSEITLLEVYLHTKELRNQIEVIGSICNVHSLANSFSVSPLENLVTQTNFSDFPRGGNLLTFLYKELQVADPVHSALLRTLFIRTCEPYFDFIRSWIFKAKITDPFKEFIVAEAESNTVTIREQDGVYVPCFLREFLIPLFRAGQQLQVLIKLLEFSDGVGSWNRTYEDFLPYWSRMSSSRLSHAFHMDFNKEGIEMMVLKRRDYYQIMMEKLKNHLPNLEFKYHQVITYATLPTSGRGSMEVSSVSPAAKNMNRNLPLGTVECDASSMTDEYSYLEDSLESSECSSVEDYGEEEKTVGHIHDPDDLEKKYLSALEINSETYNIPLKTPSQDESPSTMVTESHEPSHNADLAGYSTSLRSLKPCEVEHANIILGSNKLRERCSKVKLPTFDFESVKNPLTECADRLGSFYRTNGVDNMKNNNMRNNHNKGHVDDAITVKKNSFHTQASFGSKSNHQEQEPLLDVSGGGCWESLLDGTGNDNNIHPGERKTSVGPAIEIPLDFVLEKCLLEEIQLQYMYVSKLTIKLLEEGFSLQQHLLALRRYHMMESADWADLFIVSLWQHKWYAREADKRISEIQGLLELAVQRSSCEKDHYKDRLFVYMKEQDSSSLPSFTTGIQSFNGLGLGYRVDWPVSIVLTPGALKIYAQIFSFLIQVKLASSSLTEVWCSFKESIHFTDKGRSSNVHKSKSRNFNIMVKLRHQIYHFVSTLQQYVQSQLSHVSWCRFLQSLKHKVKDLTDLDIVHMDYLKDSQCICFLSNDMKQIADIIQSILQCALDFRSVAALNGGLPDVSQVLAIKQTFDQNIKQLYTCYLNSPKNVEFSLPRFWEYLDYNHHYSNVINEEMGHRIFSI
ncbi:putative gamma-tubulin complex component protein [Helianthus annuus]|nr:putative gamma-tubulin complex component protein [Helianthus annuus]